MLEGVIDEGKLGKEVSDDVGHFNGGWRRLRDHLDDIPTGYDYYLRYGDFDYVGLDGDDFEDYKQGVLEWGDDNEIWDEDDDDEDDGYEDGFSEEEPEEPVAEEDFSLNELFCRCSVTIVAIQQQRVEERRQEDEAFGILLGVGASR